MPKSSPQPSSKLFSPQIDSARKLVSWFQKARRDFPWREPAIPGSSSLQGRKLLRDPYRVWVSEIMLQQTRAQVVVAYFNRFIKRWPTIQDLAQAEEEEVVKMWEGLGYYRRARALSRGAKQIVQEFDGVFPRKQEALLRIEGIGPYTSGAIASLAFNERVSALDGNALRVLSRFFGVGTPLEKASTRIGIEKRSLAWSKNEESSLTNEALIELGALICRGDTKPSCTKCPLQNDCYAHCHDAVDLFPQKKKPKAIEDLYRPTLIARFFHQDSSKSQGKPQYCAVWEVVGKEVMQGLWQWPYMEEDEPYEPQELHEYFREKLSNLHPLRLVPLKKVSHTFTHFRAHLYPLLGDFELPFGREDDLAKEKKALERRLQKHFSVDGKNLRILDIETTSNLPFSSGHRKLRSVALNHHQPF